MLTRRCWSSRHCSLENSVVGETQPRQDIVEARLALRQGDHGLEMQLDAVALERIQHGWDDLVRRVVCREVNQQPPG